MKMAGPYSLPPFKIPTAEESQTEVAVVRPCTSGTATEGSSLLLPRVPFQIEAARFFLIFNFVKTHNK